MVLGDDGMGRPRPYPPRAGDIPGDETIPPPGRFERPDDEPDAPPTVRLAPPVFCSACGTPNRPTRPRCEQCGEPLHPPRPKQARRRSALPTVVLVLVGLALLAVGTWFVAFARGDSDAETPPQPSATEVAGTPSPSASEPETVTYVVERGDSLSSIAQRFSTTVEAIVAENDLADPDVLSVGQELVIPEASSTATPTASG